MAGGQPMKYKTVEELEAAIDNYFAVDAFFEGEYLPTMSGLAISLDIDRKTLLNYGKKEEYFPSVKRAKSKVETFLEQRLYGNTVTGVIFNLKNNFGWTDKQEIQNTNVEVSHEDWLKSLE